MDFNPATSLLPKFRLIAGKRADRDALVLAFDRALSFYAVGFIGTAPCYSDLAVERLTAKERFV